MIENRIRRQRQRRRAGQTGALPCGRRWVRRAGRLWREGRGLARRGEGQMLALDARGVQLSEGLFCALFGAGRMRPRAGGGFLRTARRAGAVFYAVGGAVAEHAKPC